MRAALTISALVLVAGACGSDKKSSTGATTTAAAGGTKAKFGTCEITSAAGSLGAVKLVKSGELTVATSLVAPGYWNGAGEDDQTEGLEYCMSGDIANRLGLTKVTVKNVDFAALQAGQVTGFDIALSQITINDDRKKVVDFTDSYFTSDQALMVLKGTTAATIADVQKLKLGSQSGTTGLDYINETIKPTTEAKSFADTNGMFNSLITRDVRGIVFDTAILLPQSRQAGYENTQLIAQFKTGEGYGILLPKGSANTAKINDLLAAMKADGSLARFSSKYVQVSPADVAKIPFITP
jgi:polar amino acid transport system substrate-binding protein